MKFLLDTNVLSEALKTTANQHVINLMERHRNEISTAAPVWHELYFGCLRLPFSRKREFIDAFLREAVLPNIPILPYDEKAAFWHAEQRSKLVSEGKTPPFTDGQIAAIAAVNGLTLVSRNISNFENFTGLKTVNWHD